MTELSVYLKPLLPDSAYVLLQDITSAVIVCRHLCICVFVFVCVCVCVFVCAIVCAHFKF